MIRPIQNNIYLKNFKQSNVNSSGNIGSTNEINKLKKRCITCGTVIGVAGSAFAIAGYKNCTNTNNYILKTILLGLGWALFITGTYFLEKRRIQNIEKHILRK